MKRLDISFDGIHDSTGYLFSFAKSLSAAVKHSPFAALYEDIIATSGFAFRMWVNAELCPSAMSIWAFSQQKPWVENGGLTCGYIERLWGQDDIEEARREEAVRMIKTSIDSGIAAVVWDVAVPEWGLAVGYDDETQKLLTMSFSGEPGEMDYQKLGKNEIPILNVLTITGKTDKTDSDIISGTLAIAKKHLTGGEWTDNAKGLAAYTELTRFFEMDNLDYCTGWTMEYCLGTYAALKWYAWKYLEKCGLTELAGLYKTVYECWQAAFDLKKTKDLTAPENRDEIARLLKTAEQSERQAVEIM